MPTMSMARHWSNRLKKLWPNSSSLDYLDQASGLREKPPGGVFVAFHFRLRVLALTNFDTLRLETRNERCPELKQLLSVRSFRQKIITPAPVSLYNDLRALGLVALQVIL